MVLLFRDKDDKHKKMLLDRFGKYCYCSSGKRFIKFLEFVDNRVNKFFALQEISDILNIPISEFAAIGNEQNDVLSLENVGFGVGVDFENKHLYVDMDKINFLVTNESGNSVALAIDEMERRRYF